MMIPDSKFREIAKGLFEKSKQGKVEWKKDASPNDAFRFQSPQFSFFLNYVRPRVERDYIELVLQGPRGEEVGKWRVFEDDENGQLASELYSEVSRKVIGWDKVLQEVEKFIGSK